MRYYTDVDVVMGRCDILVTCFMQDLMRAKVGLDLERMNLESGCESLKRCLNTLS